MAFKHIKVPSVGEKITMAGGKLQVPERPIIPFIEGDGTGPDIWRASQYVFDHAVEKAYGGKRKISWMEVFAGGKSYKNFNTWLPDETVEAFSDYLVGIKGPLTTPVGGGIRSLNVALRQLLDLYVCLRPIRYFNGVPSPVKTPEKLDMVIFRLRRCRGRTEVPLLPYNFFKGLSTICRPTQDILLCTCSISLDKIHPNSVQVLRLVKDKPNGLFPRLCCLPPHALIWYQGRLDWVSNIL